MMSDAVGSSSVHVNVPVVPKFFEDSGMKTYHNAVDPVGYDIQGDSMQIVTIPLAPGQKIQAEPGVMVLASEGMKQKTKFGGIGRMLSGESIVKSTWENTSSTQGFISLTPNEPGNIIPVNLDEEGGVMKCKSDAFMASVDPNLKISISTLNSDSCLACCCSGMGMFMQSCKGSGILFLQAHGTIMEKVLQDGEEIVVDTNSVVAVSDRVTVDVVRSGGCCSWLCSGEGIFNTTLKGPGRIILCSMPIEKLRKLFPRPAPKSQSAADEKK
jgi:uncharacterized protein (AIM24 family)